MDAEETFNWLEELANTSIEVQRRAPIENNRASIESSTEAENTASIEKTTRKPRHYKGNFGGFCTVCNTFFPAKTSKKKTCSEACKSRLKRQRAKVQEIEQDVLWALGDLQKLTRSEDRVLRKKAKLILSQLQEQMTMTCEEVGLKPPCQP